MTKLFTAVHAVPRQPTEGPPDPLVIANLCVRLNHPLLEPLRTTLVEQQALIPEVGKFHPHLEYRCAASITDTHVVFIYQWRTSNHKPTSKRPTT